MATENKIKEYKDKVIEKLCADLNNLLCETRSPIEELFLLSFLNQSEGFKFGCEGVYDKGDMIGLKDYALTYWYACEVKIRPQAEIEKFLTVDFKIEIKDKVIIVECDGHDFHEKTKEQVCHDKQRDRKLAHYGYTVLRFSGSEIYANPNKCVSEVESFIIKILQTKQNG